MNGIKQLATILSSSPTGGVTVWWEGMPRQDLVRFDEAGFQLIYDKFSLDGTPQEIIINNIKLYLNDLLASEAYDFTSRGPILLNEGRVKTLLGIK